jgi:hypothetical protein
LAVPGRRKAEAQHIVRLVVLAPAEGESFGGEARWNSAEQLADHRVHLRPPQENQSGPAPILEGQIAVGHHLRPAGEKARRTNSPGLGRPPVLGCVPAVYQDERRNGRDSPA